ncbi:glycosyltransferase family 4 protein [Rhodosalinus halophilus]|nr:glycosyltransferase family 4 protein [Rhodosalinus halophilus]
MTGGMGRLSVLFVVPRFHPNLFVATRALVEAGHRVTVMADATGPSEDHSVVQPVVLGRAPGAAAVARSVETARPDLVFLRNTSKLKEEAARAARRSGAALWYYDLRPLTEQARWTKRLRRRLAGLPLRRVTPVPGLDAEAPADPLARYLPWPVARDPAVPLARGDGPVTVICVGKLSQPRKNLHLAIEALRDPGRAGRARLQLVGTTDRRASGHDARYLAHLEAAAQAESWIELHRDVPLAAMPALYAAADICVMPSIDEPLGYAPVEAMAYGAVPVISTAAGSAGYLTEGRDGVRVDIDAPGALDTALHQLVNDAPYRARLAAGARATAESELSPARFLERIEALAAEG